MISNVELGTECVVCNKKAYLQIEEIRIMECNCTVNLEDFTPVEKVPQVAVYGQYAVIRIGKLPKLTFGSYIQNACVAVVALVEPDSIQILCDTKYKNSILDLLNNNPIMEQRGCGSIFMKRP